MQTPSIKFDETGSQADKILQIFANDYLQLENSVDPSILVSNGASSAKATNDSLGVNATNDSTSANVTLPTSANLSNSSAALN